MALSDYGTSFSPLQRGPGDGREKPGGGGQPTQEAIRTISTRIPRMAQGGAGIAPQPLLNAPGGMGMASPMGTAAQPNLGGLEELIRRLFGLVGGGQGQPGMGGSPMGAPAPHVTPGIQGPATMPTPAPPEPTDIGPQQNWGNFNPGQQGGFPTGPPAGAPNGVTAALDPSNLAARAMWGGG